MKYSLYDYLLNEKNPLSHVFLECMSNDDLKIIADRSKGMTDEQAKKRKLEVKLTIDGINVNPENFFKLLVDQWEDAITVKARELVEDKMLTPFRAMSDNIYNMEQIVKSWTEEINWDKPNPLQP